MDENFASYSKTLKCGCVERYKSIEGKPQLYIKVFCNKHGALAKGTFEVIK
jgi:hypothetical protein